MTSIASLTIVLILNAAAGVDEARLARWDAGIAWHARSHAEAAATANRFGGVILVARGEKVLFEHAYGLADRESGIANQVDTKFNIGSMNKMMTAVAIAQLEQAGRLSFQDSVSRFLPDYPDAEVSPVTLHQLLTHTAGLGDFLGESFRARRDTLRNTGDFLPLFAGTKPKFAPGSKWAYSNAGYILLGMIIERVSGQSYEEYVSEHIAKPAGMGDTGLFALDDEVANRAKGYTRLGPRGEKDRRLKWDSASRNLVKGCSAGGGFSTAPDLHRFALALLQNRLLDASRTKLVTAGKVATKASDPHKRYAYGFFETVKHDVREFGHGGAMYGVNADLHIFPETGYVVIALSNYDPPSAQKLAAKIVDAITAQVR